ncbi:class I SAM-dependent RNA methyltransferase [Chloroflexota bacterium]
MRNEPFEVTLDKMTHGGDAMGRLPDSRAVFVPYAIPGEHVRLRLVQEKRRFARAELLDVLDPSPLRIIPRCPHFGECGGCQFQHISYPFQIETKAAILVDQLDRIGHVSKPPLQVIQPSHQEWDYRNHIQFHLDVMGRLGYLAPRSRQVVPISECHLPEEPLNALWPQLEFEAQTGVKRISLRLGEEQEILVVLEGDSPETPILELESGISVIHQYQGEHLVLAGEDHIFVRVQPSLSATERIFKVSAGSFFQVNTKMAAALVDHLLQNLPEKMDTLLDVYCGVGLFSAFLAPRVSRLVAVELSESACDDFVHNLDEFEHVELYQADAGMVLPSIQVKPEVVLVDPPRSGLQPAVLDAILEMDPESIAYISCDPATLSRDAARLVKGGYALQKITPFDLFPQTHHIESVSFFSHV